MFQVARAGDLADWLVRKSMMHPAMRDVPVRFDMTMGGWPDPTTRGTAGSFEPLTLQLQRAAYRRAITLVQCVPSLLLLPCPQSSTLRSYTASCMQSISIKQAACHNADASPCERLSGERQRNMAGSLGPTLRHGGDLENDRCVMLVVRCRQRRPVIEQVARELCHPVGGLDGIEQVDGHRIVELLETTPLAPVQPDPDAPESAASSAASVSKVGPCNFSCYCASETSRGESEVVYDKDMTALHIPEREVT